MFAVCVNSCRRFCRTPVLQGNQERHNRRRSYERYSVWGLQYRYLPQYTGMYTYIIQYTSVCMCYYWCMYVYRYRYGATLYTILSIVVYYTTQYVYVCYTIVYVLVLCMYVYVSLSVCVAVQRQRLSVQCILLLCMYVCYTILNSMYRHRCMYGYAMQVCMCMYTYCMAATLYWYTQYVYVYFIINVKVWSSIVQQGMVV